MSESRDFDAVLNDSLWVNSFMYYLERNVEKPHNIAGVPQSRVNERKSGIMRRCQITHVTVLFLQLFLFHGYLDRMLVLCFLKLLLDSRPLFFLDLIVFGDLALICYRESVLHFCCDFIQNLSGFEEINN